MYQLLYFIILIILLLYFYINYYNQNIENFYTLFLPYYDPNNIKKYNTFKNNYREYNQPKYNVNFYKTNQQLKYTNFLLFLKSLIAYNYPIINVNFETLNSDRTLIQKLNTSTNNDLTIIPAPIMVNESINNNLDNLRFITSMNEQYIFILSPIDKNIDTIFDLHNKKIGVGEKGSLWDQCAKDIFNNINIKYQPHYLNLKVMLQELYNDNIDAILITDSFPSNLLNFIFHNFFHIHLISLEPIHNLDFYYTKKNLDLNKLSAIYIPQASYKEKHDNYLQANLFNNFNRLSRKYLFYYSNFVTYKFSNYLLANKDFNNDLGYMITKHIFNNSKMLEKSKNAYSLYPIEFNKGAKKYYLEKGYATHNSNINCIYMYGKQRCDSKSLKNNLLNNDPYYNLL